MLTMQEFYDRLSSDDRQKDSHWQILKQLVNTSLDRIRQIPNELGWYFWRTSEVNT